MAHATMYHSEGDYPQTLTMPYNLPYNATLILFVCESLQEVSHEVCHNKASLRLGLGRYELESL